MAVDPSSNANLAAFKTTHIVLDLTTDFEEKRLHGTATLTLESVGEEASSEVVLDAHSLVVSSCTVAGDVVPHVMSEGVLGSALAITLSSPVAVGDKVDVCVAYATSADASGIQWLAPEQTADKTAPYMFTQCQAIHARSVLPCQDSPSVKATYEAKIHVPAGLVAVMSALPLDDGDDAATLAAAGTFGFSQPIPIPSYLVSVAVGAIESREIGPRSRVWAEPSVVEAAANEFVETEQFLATAEAVTGIPYVWGRYDLLVLPPSFPYGGMELPNLTLVTPTLLAGDRSLANVVIHEIAHSWTGNLVTNLLWSDFWLNEGHTMYLERRVLGELRGEATRQFAAYQGREALRDTVDNVFGPGHAYTCLVPDLSSGVDPDDVFSRVPYEKGFALLYYLETLVGGIAPMQRFLHSYLNAYKFESVSTETWRTHFVDFFTGANEPQVDDAVIAAIDWETWFHAPGMPPVMPDLDLALAEACWALAKAWAATEEDAPTTSLEGWHTTQIVEFLKALRKHHAETPLPTDRLAAMDAAYAFSDSQNAEILFVWCLLGIDADYEPVITKAVEFATRQGRMKFTRPLFRALYASESYKQLALDAFAAHRSQYHPICAKMVARDLDLQ